MIHAMRAAGQSRFVMVLACMMLPATAAWAQSSQLQVAPATSSAETTGQTTSGQSLAPAQAAPPVVQAPLAPPSVILAPQTQNPAPQDAVPPAAASNPGLIEEFGKLLQNSASGLSSTWRGSQQTIDAIGSGAQGAAKGATDAIISGASQTMVRGRSACPVAGNGAPDCKSASDHLCKAKGYRAGASVDIETAETCNPKVYISGRTGAPGECKTQNFVTRALCQ